MWKVKITRKQELRYCLSCIWNPPIQAEFTLHCVSRKLNVSCMVSRRALSHLSNRFYVKTAEIVAASTDLGNVAVTSQDWWFPSFYVLHRCSQIHHGWQWIGHCEKLLISQDR